MFKKVQRYIKQQPLTVILGCLLIVQILMIAVCNIKLIDNNGTVKYDYGKLDNINNYSCLYVISYLLKKSLL